MSANDSQQGVRIPALNNQLLAEQELREAERRLAFAHQQAKLAALATRDGRPNYEAASALKAALSHLESVEESIRRFRKLVETESR